MRLMHLSSIATYVLSDEVDRLELGGRVAQQLWEENPSPASLFDPEVYRYDTLLSRLAYNAGHR